jgi:general stress protein 26
MGTTKNLVDQTAIEKLKELIDTAKMCHFVTALDHRPLSSRPMSTQEVESDGTIWFFSQKSSQKNFDIEKNPEVQLFYTQVSDSEYLSVYGTAEIVTNRLKAEELWSPLVKAWFNQGIDDPELSLIKVTPLHAYYWDTKHNRLVQLLKIMAGSVIGRPLDDGVEGRIKI